MARIMYTSVNNITFEKKKSCFTHVLASTLHAIFTTAMGTYLYITGDLGYNLVFSK